MAPIKPNFFFEKLTPIEKGGKEVNEIAASHISVPFHLKLCQLKIHIIFGSDVGQCGTYLGRYFIYLTVQILCIETDRSQQTVQTKIRLLLKKQSDQGLRCLP